MDIDIDDFNRSFVANEWSGLCNSAQMRATTSNGICSPPFLDLIEKETQKFVDQSPPQSIEQLDARRSEEKQLGQKVQSILHASTTAQMNPKVAGAIHEATKRFCDANPLTTDCGLASQSLSSHIQRLIGPKI